MTMRITGSRRRAPWQGALRALIITGIIFLICLILLELVVSFLVDWLWFSEIGYLDVFWTTIVAEVEIFIAVFIATSIVLWVNGLLALRFSQSRREHDPADFEWKSTSTTTLPDALEFARHRLPWRGGIPAGACFFAMLAARGEGRNARA